MDDLIKALEQRCKNDNINIKAITDHFKVASLNDLTEKQLSILNQYWNEFRGK